jgi:hypothetical protein
MLFVCKKCILCTYYAIELVVSCWIRVTVALRVDGRTACFCVQVAVWMAGLPVLQFVLRERWHVRYEFTFIYNLCSNLCSPHSCVQVVYTTFLSVYLDRSACRLRALESPVAGLVPAVCLF